jgi:hypothetical protein
MLLAGIYLMDARQKLRFLESRKAEYHRAGLSGMTKITCCLRRGSSFVLNI